MGNKHAFWQALIIAFFIFWIGIIIGVFFENSRVNQLEETYFDSQTDILDFELSSDIIFNSNFDCSTLNEKSVYFADNIYEQAVKLEKYDNSNKITKELITLHRRYDLLRTLLWEKIIENKKNCDTQLNTIVYLYEYKEVSLNKRGIQGAMSNYLTDIKNEFGDNLILIPIGADTNVKSLDFLREHYQLNNLPIIFVNEKDKFQTLDSLKNIRDSLK